MQRLFITKCIVYKILVFVYIKMLMLKVIFVLWIRLVVYIKKCEASDTTCCSHSHQCG
jgi:hypothetical protein